MKQGNSAGPGRLALAALAGLWLNAFAGEPVQIQPRTVVKLASAKEAAALLDRADDFTKAMSPCDRAARLGKDKPVTQDEFLAFAAASARDWPEDQARLAQAMLVQAAQRLRPLKLPLPETILLIRTTGQEEGGAAYTRGNAIILPAADAASPRLEMILHEFFHVLSRHNSPLRTRLYGLLGFKPCAPLALPESLAPIKITNPDAFAMDHYIELEQAGKPVKLMPILLSRSPTYDPRAGGGFFGYMELKLLVVEAAGDSCKAALDANGKPRLLEPSQVPDYQRRLARNSHYIISPEEVLADNFALLAGGSSRARDPGLLEDVRKVLTAYAASQPATKAAASGPAKP